MEKRTCGTCGNARAKSSFACHYDSHSEICHACKDFCIHRVKLAHSRGVTVHQLFAVESDKTRLARYNALTVAGVVWEQVARRQHSTRKRSAKRRRPSASSVASTDSAVAAPATHKRRRGATTKASNARRVTVRSRRKPASLSEFVDDARSVTSESSADSVVSAASDAAMDAVPRPSSQWAMFQDFDTAVDSLAGADLASSNLSMDEFTRVVAQLDAHAPPLFDEDLSGHGSGNAAAAFPNSTFEALPSLMLDASVLDQLGSADWDNMFMSPRPAPMARAPTSTLTVCM